jgi:hypothetical protein
VRWGVFEWNPSVPVSTDPAIYDDEMALVEQYHPSLLAPFLWNSGSSSDYQVEDTPFQTALHDFVTALNNVQLTLSRTSIDIGATTTGSAMSPAQTIRVSGAPGETPAWSITSASPELTVVESTDGRSFTIALKPGTYPAGTIVDTVTVTPSEPGYVAATLTVNLHVSLPGTTQPPQGAVDTPSGRSSRGKCRSRDGRWTTSALPPRRFAARPLPARRLPSHPDCAAASTTFSSATGRSSQAHGRTCSRRFRASR